MAKLSDLISCCSDVTGVPPAAVREISRRLREGRLIRTGTGGRYGGADMTHDDASSLLTALLIDRTTSVSLSQIVWLTRSHLRDFRSYSVGADRLYLDTWPQKLALPQLCRLKKGHSFGESLSALLRLIGAGELERAIAKWASLRSPGTAAYFSFDVQINASRPYSESRISFDTAAFDLSLFYLRPQDVKQHNLVPITAPKKWRELSEARGFDLVVTARLGHDALTAVGRLLGDAT